MTTSLGCSCPSRCDRRRQTDIGARGFEDLVKSSGGASTVWYDWRVSLGRVYAIALAVVVAALAPAIGSSAPGTTACGHTEYTSGLELVFKHFKTEAAADTYRDGIAGEGFENASVVAGCDYRVVVRGIENFDVAVDLQTEATHVHRPATIECVQGKDDIGELEVIFGHRRTRADAETLVSRAAASGFVGLQLEPDACGGFEVMIKGFRDRNQAEDFVSEAKSHGFDATIEKS